MTETILKQLEKMDNPTLLALYQGNREGFIQAMRERVREEPTWQKSLSDYWKGVEKYAGDLGEIMHQLIATRSKTLSPKERAEFKRIQKRYSPNGTRSQNRTSSPSKSRRKKVA